MCRRHKGKRAEPLTPLTVWSPSWLFIVLSGSVRAWPRSR